MTLTVEETVTALDELGLIPAQESRELLAELSQTQRPQDGAELIEALARRRRLTSYQAEALRHYPRKPVRLSNYLLLDLIGAGGMGRVFRALHERMERVVALKVLHEKTIESREAIDRFHREVKAAARLQHPNIVTAYDADEDQGHHFLVMEYVDGCDLAALVRQGPLPLAKALRYTVQAARGLEYAHSEGVIHRDIKPANLLVNSKGVVKVLDMGIARVAPAANRAHEASTQVELTQAGVILGTVDFMAPEQAIDSKSADHRADIYSLGCTLYYLLTGAPLHSGKNIVEKIIAHREREAPSLLSVRPDAPPELDELVRRMTARNPEERISTMAEVAYAMESLLNQADASWSTDYDVTQTIRLAVPEAFSTPQTVTMQVASDTLAGSRTNAVETLERYIDGCAGIDGYFDVDEEHAIFRRAGELGLSIEDVASILDRRCKTRGWMRHSQVMQQLKEMLEESARNTGAITHRQFNRLIRHAVSCKMPRRRAEEHCLTLMLDHQWRAKEWFWDRWFTRRCQKYGLE